MIIQGKRKRINGDLLCSVLGTVVSSNLLAARSIMIRDIIHSVITAIVIKWGGKNSNIHIVSKRKIGLKK